MGGKVWSAEEEKYFWEVIVPQAPAGLDSVRKQAKKEAHTAWAPLSTQMEREMTKRLKPGEHLRRKYTPIGCYEHYFQNYVNRHYSPHAKSMVLKYHNDLKAAASPASPLPTAPPRGNNQIHTEPIRVASRGSVQTTSKSKVPGSSRHDDGTTISMPEAPMPLSQVQNAPSAMDVLCDAALASQKAISLAANVDNQHDKVMIGSSRQTGTRHIAIVNEDDDDAAYAPSYDSRQSGSGSKSPAQREIREMQRDQRRTRKASHRHAQASESEPKTAVSDTHPPPPFGLPQVQTDHYNGPMMYGPHPAYFGLQYGMHPGNLPPQNVNAFQPNHAAHSNGFHPYSGPTPPHFGGVPSFGFYPHPGPGGPTPQYNVPYMGSYYTPGYMHNNGQGCGNGSAHMNGDMGGHEGMSGQDDRNDSSSGPDEEDVRNGDNK